MTDLIVLFVACAVEFASITGVIWMLGRWHERRDEQGWNRLGH